ncbi:MAG TPA: DEAD/DEAH box helicase [Gammaproteobacteria bacterium]|nr:DEAD/DEAH box helicase [Gammaproteobacteria bacterium]
MIGLREHQERAIAMLREGFRAGHRRQVLVMPTGAGKTITAATIVRNARERGTVSMFIVDRIALADQAAETFVRMGLSVSVLRGEDSRIIAGHDVVVASIQTLARRRLPDAGLLLIDECHVMHKAHAALLERWDAVPAIGLTATPFARGLGRWFSHLVAPTSVRELTDAGLLVPIIPFGPSAPDLAGVATRRGDYAQAELAARVNRVELHADIVRTWQRLGEGRSTLAFCVDIAHAKAVAEAFDAAGVRAAHVDGYQETDERNAAIRAFKAGDVRVLCSVACLAVGFDAPNASCLVLARPTKSLTMHLQQIGRGLRPFDGKADCILIDHSGNIERHGLPADIEIGALDTSTKTWTTGTSREALPRPCSACAFLKPAKAHKCPRCGFAPERQCAVETIEAEIVPLTFEATAQHGRRLYQQFLGCADRFGKRRGWAFHLYLAKVGEKPAWAWQSLDAIEPSDDVVRFARSRLIRYAKGVSA